jgi:hypothetical protein
MIKNILGVLVCAGVLAACDTSDLTSSGGDSAPTLASAPAPVPESNHIVISDTSEPDETPAADPPSEPPPPPPVVSKECGVGNYAFRTDSDNKFHFDAYFAPGGIIDYNFSVQPNTGNWSISDNRMIFNGPFGAGASNHVSTWTITNRASDCSVLEFRGKSYGQADVTATRF